MPSKIPARHYVGPNHAHRMFVERYRFLNALYYLIVSNKPLLKNNLLEASKTPDSVVGVVTHAISKTQFQGVFVPANEAREMAEDFGSFLSVLQHQTIVTAYRYFVDFCMDLLDEIGSAPDAALSEKLVSRLRERFMNLEHIRVAFQDELGVTIYGEPGDESRLNLLLATRNSIEHADCRVTKEYLRLANSGLSIGDPVPAGPKEAGEAPALVEHLAKHLNNACLRRWNIKT